MKKANGTVFKYGDNVDTDVIIPARYLNSSDPAELAQQGATGDRAFAAVLPESGKGRDLPFSAFPPNGDR